MTGGDFEFGDCSLVWLASFLLVALDLVSFERRYRNANALRRVCRCLLFPERQGILLRPPALEPIAPPTSRPV